MANILISLIGDQTAPNIFMLRDERFGIMDGHVFITTEQMERRGRLEHLLAATEIPESNYRKLIVSAEDFAEVQARLEQLSLDRADRYYLNLTSGTKIMSIGLFHYFTRGGFDVRIFYLPFRTNAYRQFYPLGEEETFALSYRITLQDYLTIYGIEWEAELEKWRGPSELTERLLSIYLYSGYEERKATLEQVRYLQEQSNRSNTLIRLQPELRHWLDRIDFPLESDENLSPAQTRYLIGGWLEQWTADTISSHLQLPASAIDLGVKIRPRRLDLEGFGNNEFDVMFLYRNTLYILECKTGLGPSRKKAPPRLFDPSLYRLAALRMEFGMNVRTALLTPDKRLRQSARKLSPVVATRAELLKVAVIDHRDLQQGPAHWVDQLVGKQQGLE